MSLAESSIKKPARPRQGRAPRIALLAPFFLVILIAVAAPLLVPYDPEDIVGPASQPPSAEFWFGTDPNGMDVFSRTVVATRIDLAIATVVTLTATLVGVLLGLAIGMAESLGGLRGRLSHVAARTVDLIESIPAVILGLAAVAFFGANLTTLMIALAIRMLPTQVRLVRTEVLRVRDDAYLDAARMAGLSEAELTFRHVLPNSSWAALKNAAVVFGVSIMTAAGLGFIGAGLPAPIAEWGGMLSRGLSDALSGRWWAATFPAVALTLVVIAASTGMEALFAPDRRRSR